MNSMVQNARAVKSLDHGAALTITANNPCNHHAAPWIFRLFHPDRNIYLMRPELAEIDR
jgi:hypothetical protein